MSFFDNPLLTLQDFEGQRKVFSYYHWIVNAFTTIGFAVGFVLKNFYITAGFVVAGFLLSLAVCF